VATTGEGPPTQSELELNLRTVRGFTMRDAWVPPDSSVGMDLSIVSNKKPSHPRYRSLEAEGDIFNLLPCAIISLCIIEGV
jgi:hypothetical protein